MARTKQTARKHTYPPLSHKKSELQTQSGPFSNHQELYESAEPKLPTVGSIVSKRNDDTSISTTISNHKNNDRVSKPKARKSRSAKANKACISTTAKTSTEITATNPGEDSDKEDDNDSSKEDHAADDAYVAAETDTVIDTNAVDDLRDVLEQTSKALKKIRQKSEKQEKLLAKALLALDQN